MQQDALTWIHLSDLHMRRDRDYSRIRILEALWRDIRDFRSRGLSADFIAVTGDIAFSGDTSEYALASQVFFDPLLDASGVTKDRLFVVPGNHDVNRRRVDQMSNPLATGQDAGIGELLFDPSDRDFYLSQFESFSTFMKAYVGEYQQVDLPAFAYRKQIDKGQYRIAIVGLNSAWLSGFNKANGKISDHGVLGIGDPQLQILVRRHVHLQIALMHHPFEWLSETEFNGASDIITRYCRVLLTGHTHRADLRLTTGPKGDLILIPAGAVFEGAHSPTGYNVTSLDLSKGTGTTYFRHYNTQRDEWQKDLSATGDAGDGRHVFELSRTLFPGQQAAAPTRTGDSSAEDLEWLVTNECRRDLASLGLTENDLRQLVIREFRNHSNYLLYDLEDYPLPLSGNHLVYMTKVGRRVEMMRVVPVTKDLARLASWSAILALYRRAGRMAYREEPRRLVDSAGALDRVLELHGQIVSRLARHLYEFYGVQVTDESGRVGPRLHGPAQGSVQSMPASDLVESNERGSRARFHIGEVLQAHDEARALMIDVEQADVIPQAALGLIVSAAERALQHIHKVILEFAPVAGTSELTPPSARTGNPPQ